MMARWTAEQFGANAKVEEHLDRRAALDGADFVINMVQIGVLEATLLDFEIPRKYGLKQTIADTLASAASSAACARSLSWSTWSREMRELCPDALLLNYSNPMSILTQAVYEAYPGAEGGGPVPQCAEHRQGTGKLPERAGRSPVL